VAAAQDHLWTFGTGSVVGRLLHLRWPSINVVITPIDPKSRITENTVFRIGSITKTFTAIAVMQLRERGLVDLDAPANGLFAVDRGAPPGQWVHAARRAALLSRIRAW
jgi:hypothetical protein